MSTASELSTVRHASGGATDALRRKNLATVLGLVHREGALSRSDLTRLTGLNRSTVGDLVGELAGLGLVEVDETPAPAGSGAPAPVSYTHLTLPTSCSACRCRWWADH